jgi:hypothetical protein
MAENILHTANSWFYAFVGIHPKPFCTMAAQTTECEVFKSRVRDAGDKQITQFKSITEVVKGIIVMVRS